MYFKRMFFLIILFLISCENNPISTPIAPDVGVPQEELNKRLSLKAPREWNSFRIGEPIALSIDNMSDDDIAFDANFGTRVFLFLQDSWIETSNQVKNYYNDDIVIHPIKLDWTNTSTIAVLPELVDQPRKVSVRIFIVGNIYEDGVRTDLKTGAFTDVILEQ